MKHFFVYDAATGAIARSGHCPDADLGLQRLLPGQALREVSGDDAAAYRAGELREVEID